MSVQRMRAALDTNYRHKDQYEYGVIRDIRLHVILSEGDGAILWGYELPELHMGCGGFPGPFEALAHALQLARRIANGEGI